MSKILLKIISRFKNLTHTSEANFSIHTLVGVPRQQPHRRQA